MQSDEQIKLTLALTGGIASGKSTAANLLKTFIPELEFFDCDSEVRSLLDSDSATHEALLEEFGPEVITHEGRANRSYLRELTFARPTHRKALENILHPRVREECLARKADWFKSKMSSVFVADVPLLFENSFDFGYDHSVVVAVSRETQITRLKARNGFDDDLISRILSAQLSVEEKIKRASFVLWNEGPKRVLESQIRSLIHHLNTHE